MEKGAFNQTSMTGEEFTKWLGSAENTHRELMKEAGFLAK
jgi:tripartite-type tricarboxylate transporter receptor subunit TctC